MTAVNHLNRDVIELDLRDSDGRVETLRPTGNHKFYSVSRNEWPSASELREGEQLNGAAGLVTIGAKRARLLGRAGPVTILTNEVLHRPTSVYNIEVQGEHVYQVAQSAVLVHNNGCSGFPAGSELEAAVQRGMGYLRGADAPDRMVEVLKNMGRPMSRKEIGDVIHRVKNLPDVGLGGADDLTFDYSGGLWNSLNGEYIGKIWEF